MDRPPGPAEGEAILPELQDALSHLRDLPIRRSHPLGRYLNPKAPVATTELQRVLLAAIEQLRPPVHVDPDAARSRRYRYLSLRYVEGSRLEEVAAQLGISARQARREHHLALQELAALLLHGAPIAPGAEESASREAASPPARAASPAALPTLALPSELESELAQVEATLTRELIELPAAIDDALGLVARFAASHSVVIERWSGDGLPLVAGTRTVLRQILLNVLSYFINSGQTGSLGLTASATAAGVELSFAARPPPGRLAAQPIGPVPGDAAQSLEVASRLAESQEGSIRIELATDGGTVLRLLLLTVQATLVLVVDDNPSLVRLFRRYVRGEGFRLVQARNGIRAHQLARELQPDVIILDLMMPVQDGWDLFRSMQQDPLTAEIPVVACSILPERELALSLGSRDFLAKPVTPESLLAALEPFRRSSWHDPGVATDDEPRRGSPSNTPWPPRPVSHRAE